MSERDALDQTASGIDAANDVDAVRTVAFVFELIVEMAEAICEFVLLFTEEAIEDDAAVIAAPNVVANEVEAERTVEFVFALIAV